MFCADFSPSLLIQMIYERNKGAKSTVLDMFLRVFRRFCTEAGLAGLAEIRPRESIVRRRRVIMRKDELSVLLQIQTGAVDLHWGEPHG